MKKYIFFLLILFAVNNYGQLSNKPPKLLDWDGTSKRIWQIGKDAGGLKWDADSLAYKLLFRDENGDLDSMWIALTDYLTGPNKVEFMASELDTLGGRMSLAESSLLLKADIDSVDALVDSIYAILALKADITMLPDSNYLDAVYSAISLKANVTYIDSLRDTLNTVSAGLIAEAGNRIAGDSTLTANLFLYALRDSIISYINISPGTIKISSDKIILDGNVIADNLYGKSINGNFYTDVDTTAGMDYMIFSGSSITWDLDYIPGSRWTNSLTSSNAGTLSFNGDVVVTTDNVGTYASPPFNAGTGLEFDNIYGAIVLSVNGGYLTSESDPTFTSSDAAGITSANIANWDSSFAWGDHASAGYQASLGITSIGGAGLTNDYGTLKVDFSSVVSTTGYNNSNWDTAYGWGDHASEGYLTSESDPSFTSSIAAGIDSADVANWNNAYAASGDLNDLWDAIDSKQPAFTGSSTTIRVYTYSFDGGGHYIGYCYIDYTFTNGVLTSVGTQTCI
jgi:hypothetical protein